MPAVSIIVLITRSALLTGQSPTLISPPVLADTGEWHVHRDRLIMDFKGDTRPADARHIELPFTFFGEDTLVVRATDGKVNTFERVK
jgi:hypothetical protein